MNRENGYMVCPGMSVILSVRDVQCALIPNACYHSLFKDSAKRRIIQQIQDADLKQRVLHAMEKPSSSTVWGILVDTANGPFVIQNLKYAHVSPAFRRVLRVY